jgi:putative nucleotidyltransferase with HDIG domain
MSDSGRILIVDDEPGILELLQEGFEEAGYNVITALNGLEALKLIERDHPEIILSDNRMPNLTGIELFERVRKEYPDTIRLLMTGYADLNIAIEAINRGWVYKFIPKPFKMEEILVTIRRALEYNEVVKQKKRLEEQIRQQNQILEKRVQERTRDLQQASDELERKNRELLRQKEEIRRLYSQLQRSYLGTITSLYFALEAKDQYTRGHSERVFHYSLHMGRELDLSLEDMVSLKYAALLHDLGKIGIPDSILLKPGKLTPQEYATIRNHPSVGASILEPIQFLRQVKDIIRHHHEHYDGNGYPDGLRAEDIRIQDRIIAVADAFDAMRSDRPYREARTREDALEELQRFAGSQFCPHCVEAFNRVITEIGDFYDDPFLEEKYSHELQFMRYEMPGIEDIFPFRKKEILEPS